MTFEERITRLEQIAAQLEGRELELSAALALFEEGVEQLRAATDELARAETRLQKLVERVDGTFDVVDSRE
jgi:exodeoxyribonuclease VII small subunit